MRARLVIGTVLAGAFGFAGVAFAAPAQPTVTAPPACVIVSGPNGLTVQAGYAPNGPSDCKTL